MSRKDKRRNVTVELQLSKSAARHSQGLFCELDEGDKRLVELYHDGTQESLFDLLHLAIRFSAPSTLIDRMSAYYDQLTRSQATATDCQ